MKNHKGWFADIGHVKLKSLCKSYLVWYNLCPSWTWLTTTSSNVHLGQVLVYLDVEVWLRAVVDLVAQFTASSEAILHLAAGLQDWSSFNGCLMPSFWFDFHQFAECPQGIAVLPTPWSAYIPKMSHFRSHIEGSYITLHFTGIFLRQGPGTW